MVDLFKNSPMAAKEKKDMANRYYDYVSDFLGMQKSELIKLAENFTGNENELFRFIFGIRSLQNFLNQDLKKTATCLPIVLYIIATESLLGGRNYSQRFYMAFNKYIEEEHKILLLTRFTFTEATTFGQGGRPLHLMRQEVDFDNDFQEQHGLRTDPVEYCSTSGENLLCQCSVWLRENKNSKLDLYSGKMAEKLYRIRGAVCHEGHFSNFIYDDEVERSPEVARSSYGFTIAGAIPAQSRNEYISFESSLEKSEMHAIFKNLFLNYLNDSTKFQQA